MYQTEVDEHREDLGKTASGQAACILHLADRVAELITMLDRRLDKLESALLKIAR